MSFQSISSKTVLKCGASCSSTSSSSVKCVSCRSKWGLLFTSDPALISVISSTLTVLALFVIFDGLSVALGGVVRGTGKQAAAAPWTLACYYLLGLPAAALLAFPLKLGENKLYFSGNAPCQVKSTLPVDAAGSRATRPWH